MSFTKVRNLTVGEALALASVEFRQDRFTSNRLTAHLCTLLNDSFQVGTRTAVDALVDSAVLKDLVEPAPGPRGGAGFRISDLGTAFVQEVELPKQIFTRREDIEDEKGIEAEANPGPVFEELLGMIAGNDTKTRRDRQFVESLGEHWLKHGWLSRKQVGSMADIAARQGLFVEARNYVGTSMDCWLRPYRDAERRRAIEDRAKALELRASREAALRESERIKAETRDANREVRRGLQEMERAGKLDGLDELVSAVFPGTNLSPASKTAAYTGSGSRSLRACIAALAFGKPPSDVWQSGERRSQLGADSEEWTILINHPAYVALR